MVDRSCMYSYVPRITFGLLKIKVSILTAQVGIDGKTPNARMHRIHCLNAPIRVLMTFLIHPSQMALRRVPQKNTRKFLSFNDVEVQSSLCNLKPK